MPVLASINACTYLPYSGEFTGPYGLLHFNTAPDWFGFDQAEEMDPVYDYYYTIDPVPSPEVGVYVIQLFNSSNVYVGDVVVTIQECNPDYEHDVCLGQLDGVAHIEAPPTEEGDFWQIFSAPDWFFLTGTTWDQGYEFIASENGTFIVVLQASAPGFENYFLRIQINVQICDGLHSPCAKRALNIVWRNYAGGDQNYIFDGIDTLGVSIGESTTIKDQDGILRYSSVKNVRRSRDVASGLIPKTDAIFLELLIASIQAWVWVPSESTFYPIVIDKSSYKTRKIKDNQISYNFSFTYGEEIIIQNQ